MPCSFIASDFPAPPNIIASEDIFILFVLKLLAIQINNLAKRGPVSLKFPNSVGFFCLVGFFRRFNPTNSTAGKPDWNLNKRLRIRNMRWISLTEGVQSPCVSVSQLFKCHLKIISHLRSGSLGLNEEVPHSANESHYTATRSLNVVIGIPGGPVQIRVSS